MANRNTTTLRALCILLGAAACAGPTRRSSAGGSPGDGEPVPAGTSARMSDHFVDSIEIRDSIIAGDLRGVRSPALHLTERTGDFPAPWMPYVAANKQLAAAALAATDLADAAQAAAGLANNCGECHAAVGLGPALMATAMAAADAREPQSMLRHQWVAERMGDALVAHSDAVWRASAEALAHTPLLPSALPSDVNYPAQIDALVTRVHDLGARAATTVAWSDRAALYGDLLATCAACHHRVVVGRSPFLARSPGRAGVE